MASMPGSGMAISKRTLSKPPETTLSIRPQPEPVFPETGLHIAATSPLVNFHYAGESIDAKRWPNLKSYVDRMHSRPAYKAVLEDEGAPQP